REAEPVPETDEPGDRGRCPRSTPPPTAPTGRTQPPARWASAPIRSRGPTTPDWTPSCWPAGTGATWSITTATGAGRRSSRISMPAGTRCTWPSRTWSTMPTSARWCARPMPSRWGPSTSSADVAGTGAERWSPTATSTRSTMLMYDANICSGVRMAYAFAVGAFHLVCRRRWNRRGAMVTDRYQHEIHHPDAELLIAWARQEQRPLVSIDLVPGAHLLEHVVLP